MASEVHMPGVGELSHLQTRIDALEHDVTQLRETVQRLCAELGFDHALERVRLLQGPQITLVAPSRGNLPQRLPLARP